MTKGKKTIEYKGNKYFIKRLVELHKTDDIKHLFSEGECIDLSTGEVFDISNIESIWKDKHEKLDENSREVLDYSKQRNLNNSLNDDINSVRVKELETNTNEMKQLKEDNIKLVEHITKLEKKLVSADELDKDKSKLIKDYMNREKEEKDLLIQKLLM